MANAPASASRRPRFEAAAMTWSSAGDAWSLTRRRSWRSRGGGTRGRYHAGACPLACRRPASHGAVPVIDTAAGGADGADGQVRQAPARAAWAGVQTVPQRFGAAHLRQRLPGGLEDVAGAFQDDHERVP